MKKDSEKATVEELAQLIDAVGDHVWYRYSHHSIQGLSRGIFIGLFTIFLCLGIPISYAGGALVGLLWFGTGIGSVIYLWQQWIFLRGDLEDAMGRADAETVASAISLAKWKDVGYSAAERALKMGNKSIKTVVQLKAFEPENIRDAQKLLNDPVVEEHVAELIEDRDHQSFRWGIWGVVAGILTYLAIYLVASLFWSSSLKAAMDGALHTSGAVGLMVATAGYLRSVKYQRSLSELDDEALKSLTGRGEMGLAAGNLIREREEENDLGAVSDGL